MGMSAAAGACVADVALRCWGKVGIIRGSQAVVEKKNLQEMYQENLGAKLTLRWIQKVLAVKAFLCSGPSVGIINKQYVKEIPARLANHVELGLEIIVGLLAQSEILYGGQLRKARPNGFRGSTQQVNYHVQLGNL